MKSIQLTDEMYKDLVDAQLHTVETHKKMISKRKVLEFILSKWSDVL